MPIYKGPEVPQDYGTNFIRVRKKLYVHSRHLLLEHKDLAQLEDILEGVSRLREKQNNEVDAGRFRFSGKDLFVDGYSSSLELPLSREAREITLRQVRLQTPGYAIVNLGMYDHFFKNTGLKFLN